MRRWARPAQLAAHRLAAAGALGHRDDFKGKQPALAQQVARGAAGVGFEDAGGFLAGGVEGAVAKGGHGAGGERFSRG